jgi:hypothetical protein
MDRGRPRENVEDHMIVVLHWTNQRGGRGGFQPRGGTRSWAEGNSRSSAKRFLSLRADPTVWRPEATLIALVPETDIRTALKELFKAQALAVEPSSAILGSSGPGSPGHHEHRARPGKTSHQSPWPIRRRSVSSSSRTR